MSLPLLHWSKDPLDSIRSREQRSTRAKPFGLWLSVGDGEDGWREWCEDNDFRLDCFTHCAEVVLAPSAQVLRIDSTEALLAFSKQYVISSQIEKEFPFPSSYSVNWPAVAAEHSGIIIAPYIWECRFLNECHWYYTWDVASGCIWDASAIAEVCPRELPMGTHSHTQDPIPMVDPS